MRTYTGRVTDIRLDASGERMARIACPPRVVPPPGRYVLAAAEEDVLGTALFLGGDAESGFLSAPPVPAHWVPGTLLSVHGPLGRGFRLPGALRRLALVGAGDSVARLLLLAVQAVAQEAAVTLFSDKRLPRLPLSLEAYPLSALPEAHAWADFLAVDLPARALPELRVILSLPAGRRLPCPGQALVVSPMPCAARADCGACAIPFRRSWKLACKDGPVFDLEELLV